jgi:hypothetical protein
MLVRPCLRYFGMQYPPAAYSKKWIRALPASRMIYPDALIDRTKYLFWRLYTPIHPYFRDTFVRIGVVSHVGRQDYLLGTITPGRTIEELTNHLISKGFGNHFVAWKDEGEVVGLRSVDDFYYQYHIRIFEDGEVRGHYEFTPESYPIAHMKEIGQEARTAFFLSVLGDWIVAAESNLEK